MSPYLYQLIVFDVDGTLTETRSGERYRHGAADWVLKEGRYDPLARLRRANVQLALATNQGGVAWGLLAEEDITAEMYRLAALLEIPYAQVHLCCTHPNGKLERYRRVDDRRKPGPGMILQAMDLADAAGPQTLHVGDLVEDAGAAAAAGADYLHPDAFFGLAIWKEPRS